jgi:hypothetical protein
LSRHVGRIINVPEKVGKRVRAIIGGDFPEIQRRAAVQLALLNIVRLKL